MSIIHKIIVVCCLIFQITELDGILSEEQRSKEVLSTEYMKLEAHVNAMQRYIVYARETKDDCARSLRKVQVLVSELASFLFVLLEGRKVLLADSEKWTDSFVFDIVLEAFYAW